MKLTIYRNLDNFHKMLTKESKDLEVQIIILVVYFSYFPREGKFQTDIQSKF